MNKLYAILLVLLVSFGGAYLYELTVSPTKCYSLYYSVQGMAIEHYCVKLDSTMYGGDPYIRYEIGDEIGLIRPDVAAITEHKHE